MADPKCCGMGPQISLSVRHAYDRVPGESKAPPARDSRLCRVSGSSERPPQVDERRSAGGITAVTRDRDGAAECHVTAGCVTKERRLLCDDCHGGMEANGPRPDGYGRGRRDEDSGEMKTAEQSSA